MKRPDLKKLKELLDPDYNPVGESFIRLDDMLAVVNMAIDYENALIAINNYDEFTDVYEESEAGPVLEKWGINDVQKTMQGADKT